LPLGKKTPLVKNAFGLITTFDFHSEGPGIRPLWSWNWLPVDRFHFRPLIQFCNFWRANFFIKGPWKLILIRVPILFFKMWKLMVGIQIRNVFELHDCLCKKSSHLNFSSHEGVSSSIEFVSKLWKTRRNQRPRCGWNEEKGGKRGLQSSNNLSMEKNLFGEWFLFPSPRAPFTTRGFWIGDFSIWCRGIFHFELGSLLLSSYSVWCSSSFLAQGWDLSLVVRNFTRCLIKIFVWILEFISKIWNILITFSMFQIMKSGYWSLLENNLLLYLHPIWELNAQAPVPSFLSISLRFLFSALLDEEYFRSLFIFHFHEQSLFKFWKSFYSTILNISP
jgi:hypothetical protein